MDYMKGEHLSEFTAHNKDLELSQKLGQALWDFYMYQIHVLKKVHADPHPGNFLISKEGDLIALDFGCMKIIPDEFYIPYFELAEEKNLQNPEFFSKKLYELEILRSDDTPEEIEFFWHCTCFSAAPRHRRGTRWRRGPKQSCRAFKSALRRTPF